VLRPLLKLAVCLPLLSRALAAGLARAGALAHAAGIRRSARQMVGTAYAMEYFRGVRDQCGGRRSALLALRAFLAKAGQTSDKLPRVPRGRAAYHAARDAFARDRAVRRLYEDKYGYAGVRHGSALIELVHKIGLQISFAYRAMWFFREAGYGLCARVTSRLMRHLYGCDIHWDAELAPGVVFVHGMGICLSHRARVGPGCILSQNVTLGMGIDPHTREQGAPTLEPDVHVGGGASLLGPIVVGAGTKIMPNAVVTTRVPPRSLVEVPAPRIVPRVPGSPLVALELETLAASDLKTEESR
jgi:serine O-acetyltransferase